MMPEPPDIPSSQGLPNRAHKRAALSTSASVYQYTPLNEGYQEIRLLRLLPGTFSSDIRVCLETTRLTEDFMPDFEALSYAWGSPKDPVNIFIGESGNHTLAVTHNLAEALPYLRYEDRTRVLWIDAISVNQQDLAERGSQVRRMADIFSNASQVLVWLGPASNDSSVAFDCMRLVSSKITVHWIHYSLSPLSDELHWADINKELPFTSTEFLAISNIFNRDWFTRLWIWQEVRLARNAMVMCGTDSLSWTDIRQTVFCLRTKPQPTLLTEEISYSHIELLYRLCNSQGFASLLDLIEWTKYSLCSDNRDRIFALLSMLNESGESLQIEPNYTKNHLDVYQEIVVRHNKHSKNLNIVTAAERHEHVAGRVSWVPDWSVPRQTRPIRHGDAGGCSMSQVTLKRDGTLQVTGIVTAAILVADRFNLGQLDTQSNSDLVIELQRMAERMDFEGFVNESPGNLKKLGRALCSNDFSSQFSPPPTAGFPSLVDSEMFLQTLLMESFNGQQVIDALSLGGVRYLNKVAQYCSGRSLFKSIDGHIGLGPEGTRPGDLVTAWLGCGSTMILRPTGSGQYLVVGEAYCSGLMDGSAFLGPLPNYVEIVEWYEEASNTYLLTFINRTSGELYPEDPRLEGIPLPEGWSRHKHPRQEHFTWFVNDSTGENSDYFDPRLSPDALKGRGVKLQVFNLV